jgi:D-xylose transport system ATP-binding protein
MRGIDKSFGGVHAVEDVSLCVEAGEVLGLLGHNGAGKSTLIKALSGAEPADRGEIRIAGEAVTLRSPRDAQRLGIETIYQDLALADNLDAVANLFLGREITRAGWLDEGAMERAGRDVIARINPDFTHLRTPVGRLSGGQRQSIAIARALLFDAKVLIMDEPTAALGPGESHQVIGLIERLKAEDLGVILVSHDLHDVFDLSDRILVMKNGREVATRDAREITREQALQMIVTGEAPQSAGSR